MHLPTVNACLNATCAVLLLLGYREVKAGRIASHRRYMIAAFCVSVMFLTGYITYHLTNSPRPFPGQGWIRPLYFTILISHSILAAPLVPMAIVTLYRGLYGTPDRHRKLAKITFPVWVYVSVTGVIVYWFLYRMTY